MVIASKHTDRLGDDFDEGTVTTSDGCTPLALEGEVTTDGGPSSTTMPLKRRTRFRRCCDEEAEAEAEGDLEPTSVAIDGDLEGTSSSSTTHPVIAMAFGGSGDGERESRARFLVVAEGEAADVLADCWAKPAASWLLRPTSGEDDDASGCAAAMRTSAPRECACERGAWVWAGTAAFGRCEPDVVEVERRAASGERDGAWARRWCAADADAEERVLLALALARARERRCA